MINSFHWANVVAVEDDLTLELVPVRLDLDVLLYQFRILQIETAALAISACIRIMHDSSHLEFSCAIFFA